MNDTKHFADWEAKIDAALARLPREAAPPLFLREAIRRELQTTRQLVVPPSDRWWSGLMRIAAAGAIFVAGLAVGRTDENRRASAATSPAADVQRTGTQYVASIARLNLAAGGSSAERVDGPEVAVAALAAAAAEVASFTPNDTLLSQLARVARGAREHLGTRGNR
ncbi:MAG TPA: hypothetical protein VHE78_01185 [Gemmatimonadaceae bacterium]|nr:hypothetical protein [Gemmatimonadaceae bacterium]